MRITTHEVEVNSELTEIDVAWRLEECECTSEFGNQIVVERWEEPRELFAINSTKSEHYNFEDDPQESWEFALLEAMSKGKVECD